MKSLLAGLMIAGLFVLGAFSFVDVPYLVAGFGFGQINEGKIIGAILLVMTVIGGGIWILGRR